MSLIQNNIFGDNILNVIQSRELTDDMKDKLLNIIHEFHASSAVIRYEHGGETKEFSEIIANFLSSNDIKVNMISVMQSEIVRNEFSIVKHPSDSNYVIIKIGPIN